MAAKGIRPSGSGKAGGPGNPASGPKVPAGEKASTSGKETPSGKQDLGGKAAGVDKAFGAKATLNSRKAPGVNKSVAKAKAAGSAGKGNTGAKRRSQPIPEAVTNRMARRIAVAMGVPSLLGMASFVVSYLLVSRGILDIPPAITLVTSGGFFLLGLVGLSYGLFSASWESQPGSLLGFEQIGVNIARLKQSLKQPPAAS